VVKRVVLLFVAVALLTPATADAAFPGANGKIAFVRAGDIWTMNPDGTGQVNLTNSAADEQSPAWSPDGNRIAFDSNGGASGVRELYWMLADGSGVTPVPPGPYSRREPAWSPDGNQLAYIDVTNVRVVKVNLDGTGETILFHDAEYEPFNRPFGPTWSPDGNRIAFTEETYPGPAPECMVDVVTVNADGTGDFFNVTNCEGTFNGSLAINQNASWSPDGARIAFRTDCSEDCFVGGHTINADGTDRVNLGTPAYEPAWSPDGSKIAYGTRPVSLGSRIGVVNPDGTNIVDLTDGGQPDWQPIPINSYPRPKGATPFRASLTTAYDPCTAPDRTHGPPLAFGSCSNPQQASSHLTVGTGDANGLPARNEGELKLSTQVGAPGGPDDADVHIALFMDDVFTNALADYTGEIRARVTLQITDKDNTPHPGGPGAATTTLIPLDVIATCTAVPDPQEGSVCTANTSADALAPGTVKEGRRAIWQLGRAEVYDGGPDGDADTPAGDTLFATQGLFIP